MVDVLTQKEFNTNTKYYFYYDYKIATNSIILDKGNFTISHGRHILLTDGNPIKLKVRNIRVYNDDDGDIDIDIADRWVRSIILIVSLTPLDEGMKDYMESWYKQTTSDEEDNRPLHITFSNDFRRWLFFLIV